MLSPTEPSSERFEKVIYSGKWLSLYTLSCTKNGVILSDHECLRRLSKKKHLSYDALTLVPIMTSRLKGTKQLLMIAEFRPPVGAFVLEFPAGLAEHEEIMEDIEREMMEETGYSINKSKIYGSPLIAGDPTFLDITAKIFTLEIDLDDERNKNPSQKLEESENIRIHMFDIDKNLMKNVMDLVAENKYIIHDKIYFLVKGICRK